MKINTKLEDLLNELDVNENGLTEKEAKTRIEKYGLNELVQKKKKPLILKFLAQFNDILTLILIVAAIISVIIPPHEITESIIILIVVIINAVLGTYQENKAEKSLDALKKMSSPLAKVVRDNNIYQIESRNLVPGDIIICEAGDFIPADARIITSSNLKVDESALTGESLAVNKNNLDIKNENIPLGDQKNKLFSSTFVTYGTCKAVVVDTGMNTEIGKIAGMLMEEKNENTPLQDKLEQIGKVIGLLCIGICFVVFFLEWIAEGNIFDAFKNAVALAVAAIPEGLATVVTVVLAIGVQQMAKEKAIIKKLPAVETLGCTEIVCSDKTGTLTQNKMTVVKVFNKEIKDVTSNLDIEEKELLKYFSLCVDASINIIDGIEKRVGDPTETALIEANNKFGLDITNYKRLASLPFDSERKMMTVFVKDNNNQIFQITKGAPDIILSKSNKCFNKSMIENANNTMAENALRVLGVGIKKVHNIPTELKSEKIENDLEFIGLVGMIDPAREEVKESIKQAEKAGITTIMITGDHVITAKAIAKELGILKENDIAVSSLELQQMTDEELNNKLETIKVYARVAPEDKVRIVKAWQSKNKVVAMTGDGVNDSPALKQADIGCAMGITGTDVAKEASAMILVDDNFSTIIKAVKQGRGIYSNIKKTVQFLLSSNIGEVVTIFFASLLSVIFNFDFGIPLLAIHLLWINLLTDSLPALALGFEKPEDNVMNEKPRQKNESFFANKLGYRIFIEGMIIGIITLLAYIIGHTGAPNTDLGHTMAFITLSLTELLHSFNMKDTKTVFKKETFNNKLLNFSFIIGVLLLGMLIYIPGFANIFKLVSLEFKYLLICILLSFVIVIVMEIEKYLKNKTK